MSLEWIHKDFFQKWSIPFLTQNGIQISLKKNEIRKIYYKQKDRNHIS